MVDFKIVSKIQGFQSGKKKLKYYSLTHNNLDSTNRC